MRVCAVRVIVRIVYGYTRVVNDTRPETWAGRFVAVLGEKSAASSPRYRTRRAVQDAGEETKLHNGRVAVHNNKI